MTLSTAAVDNFIAVRYFGFTDSAAVTAMDNKQSAASPLGLLCVVFEDRDDGGLRVYSDDVPGFVLSHSDREAVMADMIPAMETILGEMMKHPVKVVPSASARSLPWFSESKRETREYRAVSAA